MTDFLDTEESIQQEIHDKLAAGLEPCAGVDCERWLDPVLGQVVVQTATGDVFCGDCAMLHDDYGSVAAVAHGLLSRGVVLGRRFSVGWYTPAVRQEGDPDWCVLLLTGNALYLTHDAFEAARWFCRLESGDWGYDPEAPPMIHPADHVFVQLDFIRHHGLLNRRSP